MQNILKNLQEFSGSQEEFDNIINSEAITLVDFWAEWCGPCRMQIPILELFAEENKDVTVIKINVDNSSEIATKFGIRNIPTTMFFKSGKIEHKNAGLQTKESLNVIKNSLI